MAGSLQPRVKTWVSTEDVTYSDLNAEFDNVLTAMQPLFVDDYSANAAQMQVQTDPGEVGSESLSTTLAGEIARLRFAIKAIIGTEVDYWYESSNTSLTDLRQLIGGEVAANRIASGTESANSSQLRVVIPDGTNDGFRLEATSVDFAYYISNISYSLTDDVTVDGISKAPASNNTCLIDDTNAADGQETKFLGEFGTVINVDAMGSEISGLVGKVAGFKLAGTATEYFTAYVASSTRLTHARRGQFIDKDGALVSRAAFTDNDTITLMKLTWVFATTLGTISVTYNEPVYAASQPSSPATGDFWYDMTNNLWKKFNGVSYDTAAALLVGMTLQDATNCVAGMTLDQFTNYSDTNTAELERLSNTEVRVKNYGAEVSVFGTAVRFADYRTKWDMALDLDAGITEAASTTYYLYIKESGASVISNVAPHDRRGDRKGYYHPHETWRCVGKIDNDGSSNLDAATLVAFSRTDEAGFFSNDLNAIGTCVMGFSTVAQPGWVKTTSGTSVSRFLYNQLYEGADNLAMGTSCGTVDAYTFNLPDVRGRFPRFLDGGAGVDPNAGTRTAMNSGGNTGDAVGTLQADAFQGHWHDIWGTASQGVNPGGADDLTSSAASLSTTAVRAAITDTVNGTPRIAAETRPKNFNCNLFIKVLG